MDSSLWEESGDVVKVFMTMIATKTSDHVCELDAYRIARKCNFKLPDGSVDEIKVLDICKILASPDKRRKVKQEFDGRRIRAVDGGWLVLNGEKYRQMVSEEMKKARNRRSQNTYRKNHPKPSATSARERVAVKAAGDGDTETENRMAEPMIDRV